MGEESVKLILEQIQQLENKQEFEEQSKVERKPARILLKPELKIRATT